MLSKSKMMKMQYNYSITTKKYTCLVTDKLIKV